MRIRAIDEETEEYSEDLAILTGAIADLTKTAKTPGGVSLFEPGDPNTYRSTYDILADIADIWNDLTDKNQANLLEVMFGKRQAQIGSAILSNFDAARRAMETMKNSAGSAEREMEKITQSLQYQINALKETWVGIAQNLFKKGDMKAFISFLQGISSFLDFITDKIGILGTVAIGGLIVKLVLLRKEMGLINKEALQLALMNPTTWIFAALIAIPGLMMLYDKLHKTQQELYTDAENLRDKYITSQEEIKKLEEEHVANLERIEELGSKGYNSLNIAEQEELNTLRLTNAELELQIAKRKELNNITDDKVNKGYQKAFNANSFQALSGKTIGAQINSLRESNSDLLNRYADYQSGIGVGNISVAEIKEAESILGRIDELQHNITTNSVDYATHVAELIETYNDLNSKLEKGEELSSAEKQLLLDTKTELLNLSNDLEDNYINKYIGTDDFKESLIDLRDQIDATVLPLEFFKSKIDGILSDSAKERLDSLIQSGEVTADVIDTLAQRFPELAHVIDLCGFSTEKLAEYFNSLQSSSEGAAAILDPWQQTLNTFDAVSNSMEKFSDIQAAVANGFIVSAEKAREFAEIYPEILAAATTTADGQIQLNEEVVTNFLKGKQAELDADIDVQISKLQGEKAVLEAKKAGAEAQLELANAVAEGEGDISQKLAQYRLELQNKLVEQFIKLGADEVTANKLAAEAMAQNEQEFDKVATEVFKNMATNADTAAYNSAQSIYENAVQAVNSLVSIGQQAYQTAVAVAGATEGLSNAVPQANLSQLRRGQGAAIQVGKTTVSGGGKRLGIGAFNRATSNFQGQDASFVQRSVDFDSFTNDLNLQIADFTAKIAQIDSQIALLESLKKRVGDNFGGAGAGSGSGGSGGKGGSGSEKAAKQVEEYIVSIDAYREALKRLAEAENNVANIQKKFDDSISFNERIELQRQLVDAYKEEQEALHNLNNQRDMTISASVDALRELGFVVQYNADMNELWIENMDHVNELVAESAGEYETLDEATNALRKDTEEMIKTVEDLNKENQEASKQWWEDYNNIYEAFNKILDEAKAAVDDIQGYYDTLKDAAQEYAETGYINVDTLQKICEAGLENLAYLQDENGQLVINEESIQKVIAARTEQMAIETALNYVQQIRKALTEGNTEALNKLIFATESATTSTWELVYAQLESLGLSEDQYNAARQRIDNLRSLSDLALTSIGKMGESLKDTLQDTSKALDDILKYVEAMIKQEVQNQIDALEKQISDYRQIVDAQKKSLELEREKNKYTKSVEDKTKRIAELQQEIAMLDLDNSREAQTKKIQLQEELAAANEELAEEQADKAYDSVNDMLDDMADSYEKEKKDEIKILENSISSEEKLYQKAIKRIEESGMGLLDELISWNTEYGNELNSTIVSAWEAASAAVQKYGGYLAAVEQTQSQISRIDNSGTSNVVGTSKSYTENNGSKTVSASNSTSIHSIVSQMKANSSQWSATNDSMTNSKLNSANIRLAGQLRSLGIGVEYNSVTGTWRITRDDNNPGNVGQLLYDVYHGGGVAGNSGTMRQNEMLAKLEKGEIILTQGQQQSAFKLLDITETMLSRFGAMFPNIGYYSNSGLLGQLQGIGGIHGDNISVNVPIQVYPLEKMTEGEIASLTKKIGDHTISRINDVFYKNGKPGIRTLM